MQKHFGTRDRPASIRPTSRRNFAAYFNVDNGSGKIRGVYLQGIEAERPIFDAWMAPFKDTGMKTLTISNTGGTDHLSYIGVGLPGFQFIQDPLDYGNVTHHTNQDVYERLQPDDMKFNAAVVASFAWQAAQRDEKLPRPPEPRPLEAGLGARRRRDGSLRMLERPAGRRDGRSRSARENRQCRRRWRTTCIRSSTRSSKRIARHQLRGDAGVATLSTTELVHETFLKLGGPARDGKGAATSSVRRRGRCARCSSTSRAGGAPPSAAASSPASR